MKPIYRNIGCKRVQESETSSDFVLALGLVDLVPSARAALTVVLLLFLLPCGAARLPVLATFLSPLDSSQLSLLLLRVDVCANDESNNVEEWYPSFLWQELLGNDESYRRGNP